jgi:hypothetical protein
MSGIENTSAIMNIKATHNSEIRRFTLDFVSFSLFQTKLRTAFSISPDVVMNLRYVDNVGDAVTFSSDEELQHAVGLSKGLLCINLVTRVHGNPWEERRKLWIQRMEASGGKMRGHCGERVPRCHVHKLTELKDRQGCFKRKTHMEKHVKRCSKLQVAPMPSCSKRSKFWIRTVEAHGGKVRGPCSDNVHRCHARKMTAFQESKGCLKRKMFMEKHIGRCGKLLNVPEYVPVPERRGRRNLHKEVKGDRSPFVDQVLVKKFKDLGFGVAPHRIGRILSRCNGDVDSAAAFLAHKAARHAQRHCCAPSS